MSQETTPALRPDLFGQLAATDPFQMRARRLFERGQVLAVNGNQADLRVGYDAGSNSLELKEVPIVSGYVPRVGDWVAIQYEAGHSGAPWVTGPSMAADESEDSAGIGVFSVSSAEPPDPQTSTIYFDESRSVWRGWDGEQWVDLSAKLHNALPDLQGGVTDEYYHFSAAAHGALHDLYDGDGMASAWIKRLNFSAIDVSATERTRLFEKDGDFFWAINATYEEQADTWNRIDTGKYAYLIELRSGNNIPTEPIGGIAWWRAVPADNPIGSYTAVGGWELGFMMTEHRNYVMGGMNLEMDGSGSPPYGRLTQIGSNDASGTVVTAMQRNSWYEGSGQWGRDSHDKNSAIIGFDENADLFVWWYADSSEANAPWATSAWQHRAKLNLGGSVRGRLDIIRSSDETAIACSAFLAKHKASANMADGFGAGCAFAIEDNAAVENIIGAIYAVRAGADNTGKFSWHLASAGSLAEKMALNAAGLLTLADMSLSSPANIYNLDHDSFSGFVSAEHIDWTNASASFLTTGSLTAGPIIGTAGSVLLTRTGASNSLQLGYGQDSDQYAFVDLIGDATYSDYGLRLIRYNTGANAQSALIHRGTGTFLLQASDAAQLVLATSQMPRLKIESGGNVTIYQNLRVIGGDIGTAADPDLLGLASDELNVRGNCDVTGVFKVDGVQVVTNQQPHLANPGTVVGALAAWAAQVNSLLETHGLMASG